MFLRLTFIKIIFTHSLTIMINKFWFLELKKRLASVFITSELNRTDTENHSCQKMYQLAKK